ncbi:MAG: DUF669 domain-containing protein [Elusimicrobiota bacterium]
MRVRDDFSQAGQFDLIPQGTYRVEVAKVKLKETDEGNEYYAWDFVITSGEYEGRHLFLNTSRLPQALFRLQQLLQCLGFSAAGIYEWDTDEVRGRELQVKVTHEMYQGKIREKVEPIINSSTQELNKEKQSEREDELRPSRMGEDEEIPF